ncbi:hypothetical protein D3C81_2047610 [compost metagenome]
MINRLERHYRLGDKTVLMGHGDFQLACTPAHLKNDGGDYNRILNLNRPYEIRGHIVHNMIISVRILRST